MHYSWVIAHEFRHVLTSDTCILSVWLPGHDSLVQGIINALILLSAGRTQDCGFGHARTPLCGACGGDVELDSRLNITFVSLLNRASWQNILPNHFTERRKPLGSVLC